MYDKHPICLTLFFFPELLPHPPSSTLFPYTTLFRSPFDDTGEPVAVDDLPLVIALRHNRPSYSRFHVQSLKGERHERSEEHTSELQSLAYLVCRLLLEKKKTK